ncbi:SDR family NAD(P)-dependent oxidoreductase [Marinobacter mobilis]|uniref:Meso-butanediol dehydrogenase / (S,S)-butanediol dehydrogenase / diacetyl reductase n=1 Tax=Marinobacter mobilis TaxID=488533 RepID=A0A1H2XYH1_9GAMM|nr:SDR family oxidoreductase [Marinobacter mobilis]SDW97906.1 meso-butanediol dehydrogenase / (S,S)-butanediol dehydrogenase / diacetyl reductase [Marinobacter mobilis]
MLQNKKAIITGGASGIGAQAVRLFQANGADVVIADMNEDSGLALASELGAGVSFVKVDLSVPDDIENMIASAIEILGGLDILVNNAGFGTYGRTHIIEPETWYKVMEVNLNALFHTCRHALPHMMKSGGSIINTASVSGTRADYGFNAYAAAKGGVINYTRNLALDYALDNIRVNSISPGLIKTPLTGPLTGHPDAYEQYLHNIPMSRAGEPEEIAKVMLFLASDLASYVNGQNINVDGGVTGWNGQPRFTKLFGDVTIP